MLIYRFIIIISLFFTILSASNTKTPSDVYSYAMALKKKVEYLRKESNYK